MPERKERDWQKDWEACQKIATEPWHIVVTVHRPVGAPYSIRCTPDGGWSLLKTVAGVGEEVDIELDKDLDDDLLAGVKVGVELVAAVRKALPYWLQRVLELEAENYRFITCMAELYLKYKNYHAVTLGQSIIMNWQRDTLVELAKLLGVEALFRKEVAALEEAKDDA